jgi:transketolase
MSTMSDPFSFNAGAVESSYVGNLGEAFRRYGEQNEDVLLISPDLGAGPVTGAFVQQFPERFIDAGIAECNAMSMAAGMATYGYKVFVLQMGAFGALKCAEQIRTDLAFSQVPVRILSAWSGGHRDYPGHTRPHGARASRRQRRDSNAVGVRAGTGPGVHQADRRQYTSGV